MNAANQRGFSLIELTIVVVLGMLVLAAVHNVLTTNLRAYTILNSKVRSQQTIRGGSQILFAALREVSPRGGDLIRIAADSMTVRSSSAFGIVCGAVTSAEMTVMRYGRWIGVGDSVFVLADNDPGKASDDVWHAALVGTVDTTVTCGGGEEAQKITLPGMEAALAADSVLPGAPVRVYQHYTYSLASLDGSWYLARSVPSGEAEPLVGPLRSPGEGGLRIEYLDSLGATTTIPADVAQFRITLRSAPGAARPGGEPLSDTIVTRVYARN